MLTSYSILRSIILLTLATRTLADVLLKLKSNDAVKIATDTLNSLFHMFFKCALSAMPNQHYLVDDLKSFVNYPSRTTIGFAPKYTGNRKFFANMISTTIFRDMLEKDEEELKVNMIKKLKYCDEAIMDQNILKDFYDREVDQSKI